jgi:hypothetical protein
MASKGKRAGTSVVIASLLAGAGVVLSNLAGPGIHPVKYGDVTSCAALVPSVIKQYSHAAFDSKQFSAITDVTTVRDDQKPLYAGSSSVTTDLTQSYTALVCHGLGALESGGTHPVQWELQFDATSQVSSLGVTEVPH